ncbi:hypothetical protein GCM10007941_17510 [Amphritea balenae]|nr:hypothetical protein GCM10007941_17510 [Amphritea balenae]
MINLEAEKLYSSFINNAEPQKRYERWLSKEKIVEKAEFTNVNIRFAHPKGPPFSVVTASCR